MKQPWIETPLVYSVELSKLAGCQIWLKLDNLQPAGSFKSRGIGNVVRTHAQASLDSASSPRPHFFSSSGGNAGLACVTAATTLGYPSSVIVPMSTKPHMIELLKLAGASEVVQKGATWFEADTYLRETVLPAHPEGVYIHPFDNPIVWTGAATIVQEIDQHLGRPADVIVCSVGGGGLFCGIMQGVQDSPTRVIAVETLGAESLHQAVKAGELVTLPGITSLATSLGATRVCAKAFEHARDDPRVSSVVVTDAQAVKACMRFADEERMLVEPACGATLAIAYEGRLKDLIPDLKRETVVVLEVCGGKNVSLQHLQDWKETFGGP
ncbi:tryptophan synthase beta subunit-like PLP-dependent enzyme [Kockovaella imperatae]|uniref:L-serine ammonia-lyase n=1 Tax=Kockovaella imperatae TaxID=4999 RepID=A0A1Y1UBQ4_9TREE|nr:tryptophan synthase beta subunit-like PLP-dependent enzyme [Kockovaella imperatae]ORX35473.1 tryptophan synthase beta subunit-like PLP-dependent enzyme [Kockovaella imperatae]